MRKGFLIVAVVVGLLFASSAMAVELRFTEIQMPLGNNGSQIPLSGPEYAAFGIGVTNVYRYHDNRDPFSDGAENLGVNPFGLSLCNNRFPGFCPESPDPARIDFLTPVSNLEIDWWTITGTIFVDVYSTGGVLLGSFNGSGFDTEAFNFSNIGFMTWHDTGGFVQVANIRFDAVPEPGTLALFGVGLLLFRLRQRSQ